MGSVGKKLQFNVLDAGGQTYRPSFEPLQVGLNTAERRGAEPVRLPEDEKTYLVSVTFVPSGSRPINHVASTPQPTRIALN